MVPKLQKRLFLLCGGFGVVLWSPRRSRTPRNENVSHFNSAKMTKVWSSCSLLKLQRRPDRADCRTRTEIFRHECSLLEEVGVRLLSSSSLSSEDHYTCDGQVISTSVSKKPKTDGQHLVQNLINGRKHY